MNFNQSVQQSIHSIFTALYIGYLVGFTFLSSWRPFCFCPHGSHFVHMAAILFFVQFTLLSQGLAFHHFFDMIKILYLHLFYSDIEISLGLRNFHESWTQNIFRLIFLDLNFFHLNFFYFSIQHLFIILYFIFYSLNTPTHEISLKSQSNGCYKRPIHCVTPHINSSIRFILDSVQWSSILNFCITYNHGIIQSFSL